MSPQDRIKLDLAVSEGKVLSDIIVATYEHIQRQQDALQALMDRRQALRAQELKIRAANAR